MKAYTDRRTQMNASNPRPGFSNIRALATVVRPLMGRIRHGMVPRRIKLFVFMAANTEDATTR